MVLEGNGNSKSTPDNPAPDGSPSVSAVGALCIAMRKFGINADPGNPLLRKLADDGVTVETMQAACEQAKRSKPNEAISPAYVIAIVQRWAKEAAALNAKGAGQPRASPGYQTPNEKAKDLAERLTGKKKNDPTHEFVDINDPPA